MVCSVRGKLSLRFFDISLIDEVKGEYLNLFEIVVVVAKGFKFFLSTVESVTIFWLGMSLPAPVVSEDFDVHCVDPPSYIHFPLYAYVLEYLLSKALLP